MFFTASAENIRGLPQIYEKRVKIVQAGEQELIFTSDWRKKVKQHLFRQPCQLFIVHGP